MWAPERRYRVVVVPPVVTSISAIGSLHTRDGRAIVIDGFGTVMNFVSLLPNLRLNSYERRTILDRVNRLLRTIRSASLAFRGALSWRWPIALLETGHSSFD